MNIKFENISYPVLTGSSGNEPILKTISGCLYSGQLTGILGGSGAGKTTLLNILAGHTTTNISGNLSINETSFNNTNIKRISTYLMDDDLLQTSLTVKESIIFVALLKLDKCLTVCRKEQVAMEILNKLNLEYCLDTMTENLSGGEKRRLSIALELINDPPILFMDEPTSGLDEVAAKQCIQLLRTLAHSGKMVVCTIHQPSNIVFNTFEHVYFINDGYCIYDGMVNDLVPFLSRAGYPCPTNYNPADYILEMSQTNQEASTSLNRITKSSCYKMESTEKTELAQFDNTKGERIGFLRQSGVLLKRNFLQLRRRKLAMAINIAHHIMSGLLTGLLYIGSGNDAAKTPNIYKLSLGAVAYISFAYAIIPLLIYPFQVKIIKREVMNDWYSLKAYFLTQSLAPLPYLIPLCYIFTIVCFGIVDPSLSLERHSRLAIVLMFVAIVSHFYGHAIGGFFGATNACVVGSMVATISMNIGAFHHYQISWPTWLIRQTAFTRYGIVGCLLSFYQNRKLECSDVVCRHSAEKLIYDDYGLGIPSYGLQILGLTLNIVFYAVCFYVVLRIKFYSRVMERWRNFKSKYAK